MYICKKCWYSSATKLWKCPSCWEFGSFAESQTSTKSKYNKHKTLQWKNLTAWKNNIQFFVIKNKELLRSFQRWIKTWWVYLLWWEPWIGKSTILLQIVTDLLQNNQNIKIWYFSGEENTDQIIDRLKRISPETKLAENFKIFHATCLEDILTTAENSSFNFIVIDSIQTIYSKGLEQVAWTPNQVKYCSEKLSEFSKQNLITSFIIWHVTKWWEIAGPKYLEHIVDAVYYLEWDRFSDYRFLRTKKNRFWTTDNVGIYQMSFNGLQPVYDIWNIFEDFTSSMPWSVLTVGIDNGRPIIVNLEVLLNKTKNKFPKRVALWVDNNRLYLIVAILERYLNLNLEFLDVFVNLPGEFKFYDSWLDLAVAIGIYSQYKNLQVPKNKVFVGEIWLGWQILPSKFHKKRQQEVQNKFEFLDWTKIKRIVDIHKYI